MWKPSSLKTFDIYMRNRLMPHFGRARLDTIDHARVSAWFDAASAEKPGAANRAFESLRAMLAAARQWGEIGAHVPDACANIAKNPRRPVARFLDREELQRLGAVLDRHRGEHPWQVAALRLLTLTGARLSEVLDLEWDEIGELAEDGASARLEDTKTGPRTLWLGPEAARLLAALPRCEEAGRVFPDDLTLHRLYTFWCGVREEAGLPGLRIHDTRHTWASQGVMNGEGLTTVGRLLGHRKRRTTAIYAHLDDAALRDAAARAAAVIAGAMGYKAEPPPLPDETEDGGTVEDRRAGGRPDRTEPEEPARFAELDRLGGEGAAPPTGGCSPAESGDQDWLGDAPPEGKRATPPTGAAARDDAEPIRPRGWIEIWPDLPRKGHGRSPHTRGQTHGVRRLGGRPAPSSPNGRRRRAAPLETARRYCFLCAPKAPTMLIASAPSPPLTPKAPAAERGRGDSSPAGAGL